MQGAERYRIERELGVGRRARVFEATDMLLGRRVALKCALLPGQHLAEEALRLARCPEGAAVHLYDFLPGHPATLVLERLEGTTLRAHRAASGAGLAAIAPIIESALTAVVALHGAGLVHGDLKPENLWIEPTGRVRLLDLGAEPCAGGDGTALYQAPEIARGEVPSAAGDLYALAVIAFELLARRPPFDASDAAELAVRRARQAAPSLHAAGATVPESIASWVARGLERDPSARFAGAESALAAWREATARVTSAAATTDDAGVVILHPEAATRLRALVTAATSGSAVVLRGETGIGKSALLGVADAARARDACVVLVRPTLVKRRAFLDWDTAASAVNPALGSADAPWHDIPAAIAAALATIALHRSTWVLVDDPDALDGATRRLVLHLARDAPALGIHVVVTMDTTRPRRAARWMRQALEALALPGLELCEIATGEWSRFLAHHLGGGSVSDVLCTHVVQRCGGNPRHAQWIVENWREHGALRRDGDAWIFRPAQVPAELPPALERAFANWQAELTPMECSILAAGSLQGSRFDAALVSELEALPANDVRRCLVELARARGIVRLHDTGWEFRTPLLVPFWRARLDPRLRRDGHRRIAASMCTHGDPDPLVIGEQLALAGDRASALPHVLHVARAALADRDAGVALHALDLLRDAPEPASEDAAAAAAATLRLRAEALQLLADWDDAVEVLERALMLARAWGLGAVEIEVLRSLGSIDYDRSRFEEAVARYRDARTAAETQNDVRELHEIDLKLGNIHFERGRLQEAAAAYEGVLAFATAAGDVDLEARAACNVGLVESIRGRKQQAIALFDRSLQRFRQLGRHDAVAQLHQNIGMIYFELGNWAEARNFFSACMQQCETSGQDALFAVAAVDYAEATIRLGAAAGARDPLDRALAISRERGDELGVANAYRLQGQLAAAGGDRAGAEERFATCLAMLDRLGQPLHCGLAWRDLGAARLHAGDPAAARDALLEARRIFASLAAAQHVAEVETLWARCGEVPACPR